MEGAAYIACLHANMRPISDNSAGTVANPPHLVRRTRHHRHSSISRIAKSFYRRSKDTLFATNDSEMWSCRGLEELSLDHGPENLHKEADSRMSLPDAERRKTSSYLNYANKPLPPCPADTGSHVRWASTQSDRLHRSEKVDERTEIRESQRRWQSTPARLLYASSDTDLTESDHAATLEPSRNSSIIDVVNTNDTEYDDAAPRLPIKPYQAAVAKSVLDSHTINTSSPQSAQPGPASLSSAKPGWF